MKKNATSRERFETRTAKNGEVIGQSQMYAHRSSTYTGIKSVIANAPTAKTATE